MNINEILAGLNNFFIGSVKLLFASKYSFWIALGIALILLVWIGLSKGQNQPQEGDVKG